MFSLREKKHKRPINCYLEDLVYQALELFCEESGMSKTTAVERAIKTYIESSGGYLVQNGTMVPKVPLSEYVRLHSDEGSIQV